MHRGWLGWAVAALLAITLGALLVSRPPTRLPNHPVRFALDLPPGQVLGGFDVPGTRSSETRPAAPPFAISRDGTRLVYEAESNGTRHLYLKELSGLVATRLPGTIAASWPSFSPNGERLGFYAEGQLWMMSLDERSRTAVCAITLPLRGVTWLSDDTIVFGDADGRLMRAHTDGGSPQILTEPDPARGEHSHFAPYALPDGRTLLFTAATESNVFVSTLDLRSGDWNRLFAGAWPRYVDAGFIVFSTRTESADALVAAPFDYDVDDEPGAVFPASLSVYADADESESPPFAALSENGTIVYVPTSAMTARSRIVWVDRDGNVTPALEALGPYEHPRLSPNGQSVALSLQFAETTGKHEVWTFHLVQGTKRVVNDELATRPLWTETGSGVAFSSGGRVLSQPLHRRARPSLVATESGPATDWLPGGTGVFTVQSGSTTGLDIWAVRSNDERERVVASEADEHSARASRDGRWIAYVSNESGNDEIYMRPFPGPGRALAVSSGGGTDPVWSRAGNELFYRDGNRLFVVPVRTRPHAIVGRPTKLFELPFLDIGPTDPGYDVSPDGLRFIMAQPAEGQWEKLAHVILHWDEELKRARERGRDIVGRQ